MTMKEKSDDYNDIIEQINSYIESNMDKYHIPGLAIGIMKNSQPALLKGYGVANRKNDPVTPQTPFILGSTSKSFTAIALLQLAEKGMIDLDEPITKYLPLFPYKIITHSEHITARHLLNQTSGFSEADGIKDLADKEDYSLEERFLRYKNLQLTSFPGEAYQYSNINYLLAGWIIESVTNQSLNEYIKTNIFLPLNMNNSYTTYDQAKLSGLAEGYRMWFGKPVYKPTHYWHHDVATGYIISSAEDMLKYLSAHEQAQKQQSKNIITPFIISQLYTPVAKVDDLNSAYGMGWFIDLTNNDKSHSGDLEHFFSSMALINVNGTDQWGIVMLVNSNAALTQAPMQYEMFDDIVAIIKAQNIKSLENEKNLSQYIYNAILIILLIFSLGQFYIDMKMRQRAKQKQFTYLKTIRTPLLLKSIILICIVYLLPATIKAPLPVIILFQPDLGFVLVTITLLTLVAFFIHLIYSKTTKTK